jgi:hypothetical protein
MLVSESDNQGNLHISLSDAAVPVRSGLIRDIECRPLK